jgi:membrane-bound lytic murein transglycosylase D
MSFFRRVLLALAASFFIFQAVLAGEALPRPAGLEPEIGFWRRVFAECTTEQGLIHDNRYLGVVYEKVDVSADGGTARISRVSEAARGRYERILRTLASGKREGLTAEEARVLDLWPAGVTNRELREAVERVRFQQGLADRFQAGLVRSGQWREHIQQSLRAAGVPDEVAALPHVESSFDPGARSFVGAAGLWQFTGETGRRFMRIDQAVDERRDPYESSEAAASLLKYNYSVLGTWPLAITAYNHGTAGMRRAAERMGTTNIETIIRHYDGPAFGFASRNFYVSFLAALEIEQNVEKFFGSVQRKAPRNELVIELPDYMRVETLEKAFGVPRSTLQAYNPALLPPVWEGAKLVPRGFRLRLPVDGVIEAAPRQVLADIPESQRFASQVPDKTHVVRRGDTLSGIARRYATTVPKLAQANGIKPGSRIRVGQKLTLPGRPGAAPVAVARAESKAESAPPPVAADPSPALQTQTAAAEVYVVRAGDSLARISGQTGVSQRDLLAFNGIRNPDRVRSGQRLRLTSPDGGVTVAAPPKPAQQPVAIAANLPAVEVPGTTPPATGDTAASLADPSDYLIGDDGTVEVQAAETMSHFAGWLEINPDELRQANGWPRQRSLVLGQRVRLSFNNVSRETFLSRRVAYHHNLQEDYFTRYRITDTTEHLLRRGESVWVLAAQKYKVPVWLLRQYNPKLNLDQLRPGTRVVFPRVVRVAAAGPNTLAGAR